MGILDGKRNEKDIATIKRQEAVLTVYSKWIELYQNEITVSDYLIKSGYRDVVIYGLGWIGKNLLSEVMESSLNVKYVVDRAISMRDGEYKGVMCYNPDAKLPSADFLIITVPSEADDIKSKMRKKVNFPIQTIQDLLFVIEQEILCRQL